jgi:hypothetical protein
MSEALEPAACLELEELGVPLKTSDGSAHLSVWLPQPFCAQEALIGSDPERFFRPPHLGVNGWVGVVLDTGCDWREVARLVREAYLSVATAKLRNRVGPKPRRTA